jgi:hypothetical protein
MNTFIGIKLHLKKKLKKDIKENQILMELKEFQNLLEKYKAFSDKLSELYNLGFDFYEGKFELMSDVEKMFDITIDSHYAKEGVDWIDWFIYENDYGKRKLEAKDGDELICYDVKSLHEYIEKYHKK